MGRLKAHAEGAPEWLAPKDVSAAITKENGFLDPFLINQFCLSCERAELKTIADCHAVEPSKHNATLDKMAYFVESESRRGMEAGFETDI